MAQGKLKKLRQKLAGKAPVLISLLITFLALGVYYTTFIGERPTSDIDFIYRMEMASLDFRFQLRGELPADPRIVIVDIDQKSQEVLGRWPFHRGHFAKMLDNLRADGARVAAFDITFSHADDVVPAIQRLRERLQESGAAPSRDAAVFEQVRQEFDYDVQFAAALERFGHVVLGNFFLYTQADLSGLDKETLERFSVLASYHPYPQVRAADSAQGVDSYRNLVRIFHDKQGVLPRGAEANLEDFTLALPQDTSASGFFNVFPDADGVVRKAQLALPYGTSEDWADWDVFAPIEIHALRFFLEVPNEAVVLNFGLAGIESIELGSTILQPDDLGRVLINYRGGARSYLYVSIADVVQGTFAKGTFRDKIVLVGASATGIGDLVSTPFAAGLDYPGVEIHANVIDNALNGDFLQRGLLQILVDLALIVLFGVPLGLLVRQLPASWMWLGLAAVIPFAVGVQFAFQQGWWLNTVVPVVFTAVPNTVVLALYRVFIEDKEKRRTRGAFQQYVSPEVIRRLLQNPEQVRPRKIEITSLFSDVRGFTSLAEQMDAQDVAHLLNDYLTEMTGIVFRHQGTLDKYIGDAVMAFWGAPFEEAYHGPRACRAALMMLKRLEELRDDWRKQGKPLLDIGIGINSGYASVGNMGSVLRYGYTAIGDSVNLSSRLEALNRLYGSRILVGETTRAQDAGLEFVFRELDWIRVKGKQQPVAIFELLALREDAGDWRDRVDIFEAGLALYRQQDWAQAKGCFELLVERWPDDGPARLFVQRCANYLERSPEPDWDGVYIATEK